MIEAKAFHVPKSKKYPQGIKYSFQHYNPETGKNKLRYDNYAEHKNSQHHKHYDENKIHPTSFKSLQNHFKKFMKEVKTRGENP